MLLLNFVLLGERSAQSLSTALNKVGLNLTQALVLWYLLEYKAYEGGYAQGVTLTSLSHSLYLLPTRLHAQLVSLKRLKLIKYSATPAIEDKRHKHYILTDAGVVAANQFLAFAAKAEQETIRKVASLIPKRAKELDKWLSIQRAFINAHIHA